MLMPVQEATKGEAREAETAGARDLSRVVAHSAEDATGTRDFSRVATDSAESPLIARFLPSLTDVAFLMPLFFLFLKLSGARQLLEDGDTGWHLRTGEWILSHFQVPHVDMFSFTAQGKPWFAWEWGWDLMFAALFRSWGMAAVVAASTLVICLTAVALFRLIRRKCDNGLVAIAVTLLATGGCAVHWLARPHLFTFLFFVTALHITDRAEQGNTKLLAWLVPLTLVWTNIHGGFFVIFLVLACYIGSNLLNAAIDSDAFERRRYLARTKPWLMTFAACFAVTFINPYGWQLHKHVVQYMADPYLLKHIAEFGGLDFHSPAVVYFEPMMIGTLFAAFWVAKQRRFADAFLAVGWMHLALIVQRNLPLYSIACAPLIAEGAVALIRAARVSTLTERIGKVAGWFQNATAGVEKIDRIRRVHLVSAAGFALVALLLFAPKPINDKFISSQDPKLFPVDVIPQLTKPDVHRIWSTDQWGDYLIFRLYPSVHVYIDGRSDFYGSKFGEEYLGVLTVQEGWNKTLDKYGIDTIVVAPNMALTTLLKVSRDWRVVYDDHRSIVFRRIGPVPSSPVSDGGGVSRDRAIAKDNT